MDAVQEGSDPVQLADLTGFEWDTVYIFGPCVSGETMNDAVGFDVVSDD